MASTELRSLLAATTQAAADGDVIGAIVRARTQGIGTAADDDLMQAAAWFGLAEAALARIAAALVAEPARTPRATFRIHRADFVDAALAVRAAGHAIASSVDSSVADRELTAAAALVLAHEAIASLHGLAVLEAGGEHLSAALRLAHAAPSLSPTRGHARLAALVLDAA